MKHLYWLLTIAIVSCFCGCAPKATQQMPTRTKPSIHKPTTTTIQTPKPKPQPPKDVIPILLGKSRKAVQKILGDPDETGSQPPQFHASEAELTWGYQNKPAANYSLHIRWHPWRDPEGRVDLRTLDVVPPLNKVEMVYVVNIDQSGQPVIVREMIPETLLRKEPSVYYARPPGPVPNISVYYLAIVWRFSGQTYVVVAVDPQDVFQTTEKKLNLQSGQLEQTPRLNRSTDWKNRHVWAFIQINKDCSNIHSAIGGDAGLGYTKLQ